MPTQQIRTKLYLSILAVTVSVIVSNGQQPAFKTISAADTALINRLFRVYSTPYLAYSANIKLTAEPYIESGDTMTSQIIYTRLGTNFYITNATEETIKEDSLLIQIDHEQKQVYVSKINDEEANRLLSSKQASNLYGDSVQIRNFLIGRYGMQYSVVNDTLHQLIIKQPPSYNSVIGSEGTDSTDYTTSETTLLYNPSTYTIWKTIFQVVQHKTLSSDMYNYLISQDVNISKAVVQKAGTYQFTRQQGMEATANYLVTGEKLARTYKPLWEKNIQITRNGSGNWDVELVGVLRDYELIKSF